MSSCLQLHLKNIWVDQTFNGVITKALGVNFSGGGEGPKPIMTFLHQYQHISHVNTDIDEHLGSANHGGCGVDCKLGFKEGLFQLF